MYVQDRGFCLVWIVFLLTSTVIHLGTSQEGCLSPLGMEDGRIKDDQIRATSPRSGPSGAIYARFNHTDGNGGWCPDQEGLLNRIQFSQFIQVKLDEPVRIRGIDLQGSAKGLGKVERFVINYSPNKTDYSSWRFLGNLHEYFKGNIDSPVQRTILRPPIVADGIRLVPLFNVSKQVCMRFELLGCPLVNALIKYNMPQGNSLRQGKYNFTDLIYDGEDKKDILSNGLGFLTDGKLAPADYVVSSGLGWIGWHFKDTPGPYIIFEFLQTRIFHSMILHCNVRDGDLIKLFSKVNISFSVDNDDAFHGSLAYSPRDVSSGSSWLNRDVKVDLCRHIGRKIKLDFTYAGEWILISEASFKSEVLGSQSHPEVQGMPVVIPPRITSPSTTEGTDNTCTEKVMSREPVCKELICPDNVGSQMRLTFCKKIPKFCPKIHKDPSAVCCPSKCVCEDRNGIKYSPGESFNVDDGRNPRHKCKCGKDGVPECHEYYIIPPKVPRPPPVFPPPPNFPPPPHDEEQTD